MDTVFLCSPAFRGMRGDVAAAFYCHASQQRNLIIRIGASSLLTQSFNNLWCAALNARKTDPKLKYFAMIHDDIAPDGRWWLDTLIDELEAKGLDLLSVAVPIKDARGLLSCGLTDSTESFAPVDRITMKQLARMPETFTAKDLSQADKILAVNTGCWVCRFDAGWVEDVRFTINDRITCVDGVWRPEVEPEDWNFSRQLHAKGLLVGVTKKITVSHIGDFSFRNDAVWGEELDPTITRA